MKRINSTGLLSGLLTSSLLVVACTGDDATATSDTDTDTEGTEGTAMTMPVTTTPSADSTGDGGSTGGSSSSSDDGMPMESTSEEGGSSSEDGAPDPVPVDMVLEITNVSGDAVVFSPVSPGVWLNHEQGGELLFAEDAPDAGEGLEALAEDGNAAALAAALEDNRGHLLSGVFNTPVDADAPGPILPGETYRVEFTAEPFSRLSLAMMLVGSNDQIISTGEPGIGMFAGGGQVQGVRDITNLLRVWDAGTEVNQAPSQGPWQALHGGSPNIGAPESGGVFRHNDNTRALPLPADLVTVQVTQGDGDKVDEDEYTITITNTSYERGTLVTPLSGFFWMTHDDTVSMFEVGTSASAALESLAEDGDTEPLGDAFPAGVAGVGLSAEMAGPFVPGNDGAPGDTITFVVNTSNITPLLSFATMVVRSNDAFLAPPGPGISLYEENGDPRDNEDIEDDIQRLLTVWDAGTERNETPGVGPNQVANQPDANTGEDDDDDTVRIYQDSGSDLAGDSVGGIIDVSIVADGGGGEFTVRIENTSASTGYPAVLTPAFTMLHDGDNLIFEVGALASPGIETLAEDGGSAALVGEWDLMNGATASTVNERQDGGAPLDPGALQPGEFYEFNISPTSDNRFFSFAQMVVPSNDTFVAFGDEGIALLNSNGDARSDEAIASDILAELVAWDAGTEANQCGGGGRDQAPNQAGPNTGAGNGSETVRVHEDGPANTIVWSAPRPDQVVRVTLGPAR